MNTPRIYTIDPDNDVFKKSKKGWKGLALTFGFVVAFEIIIVVFIIVKEAILDIKTEDAFFTAILLLLPLPVALIKIIFFDARKINSAKYRFYKYILVEGNSLSIFVDTNAQNEMAGSSLAAGTGLNMMNSSDMISQLIGAGVAVAGTTGIKQSLEIGQNERQDAAALLEQLKQQGSLPDFSIIHYENVKFTEETDNEYVFVGDLVKTGGKIVADKKFKISKIYYNYEKLKAIG